jgi:hypothetical protein
MKDVLLAFLAVWVTIGWAVYLAADTAKQQRRMKAQAELHGRLLDKFGSAQEVVAFLQTPSGAHFVDSLSGDRDEPANGVLRSTHRGIILVIVAIGCLGLTRVYGFDNNPLLVVGVILLCLGIGFLVSAAVSHRLARTLDSAQRSGTTHQ